MRYLLRLLAVAIALGIAGFGARVDAGPPQRPPGLVVSAVAVDQTPGLARVAIELSARADFRMFLLPGPPRLVIDLPPAIFRLSPAAASGGPVAGYRFGVFDDATGRLVLDLAGPAQVRSTAIDSGPGRLYRLMVELEPVDAKKFEAIALGVGPAPQPLSGAVAARFLTEPPTLATSATAAAAPAPTPAAAPVRSPAPTAAPTAAPAPAPTLSRAAPPPPRLEAATLTQASAARGVAPPPAARPEPKRESRRLIVIDPGHGGEDPGATGAAGTLEKDVTLAAARELRDRLLASGRYRVELTRDSDVLLSLRSRYQRARELGADLFLSVHADWMHNPKVRGASVYTLSETASDAETAELARQENLADAVAGINLSRESPEVANVLIDLSRRDTNNLSLRLASGLVAELGRDRLLLPARPHRSAGFAVLKAPDVPSVLLEMGYLSNREDEKRITQPAHRARVAQAVVRAVDAYFARLDRAQKK